MSSRSADSLVRAFLLQRRAVTLFGEANLSSQPAKRGRGKPEHRGEHPREMERIGKPRFLRHLFNQRQRLFQTLGRVVHLEPEQILVGTLAVIQPEQAA